MCTHDSAVRLATARYERFLQQLKAGEISPVGQTERRKEEQEAYGEALRCQTVCYQTARCHECRESVSMAIRADFATQNAYNMAYWKRLVADGRLPADILNVNVNAND